MYAIFESDLKASGSMKLILFSINSMTSRLIKSRKRSAEISSIFDSVMENSRRFSSPLRSSREIFRSFFAAWMWRLRRLLKCSWMIFGIFVIFWWEIIAPFTSLSVRVLLMSILNLFVIESSGSPKIIVKRVSRVGYLSKKKRKRLIFNPRN